MSIVQAVFHRLREIRFELLQNLAVVGAMMEASSDLRLGLACNRITVKAELGRLSQEFDLTDVILSTFYSARDLDHPVGTAICQQIVWNTYSEFGPFLAPTTFETYGGLVTNSDVPVVIEELVEAGHITHSIGGSFKITASGLWLFESRVMAKVQESQTLFRLLTDLRTLLPKIGTCNVEEGISLLRGRPVYARQR